MIQLPAPQKTSVPRRRWHRNSVYGAGKRACLDREKKAVWRAKVKLARRPGGLTAGALLVALVLFDMLGPDGRLDPSQQTLADRARVHLSTAKLALGQLRDWGFVTWERRLRRLDGGGSEQITNAYVLLVPDTEAYFPRAVCRKIFKKERRGVSDGAMDWEAQLRDQQRQLEALGFGHLAHGPSG